MLVSLIAVIMLFAFLLVRTRRREKRWYFIDTLTDVFWPTVVSAFVVFIASFFLSHHPATEHEKRIYSLDRMTSVSGSFVLGFGSVDGGPAYCYYNKVAENAYKLGSISARAAVIIESDDCEPRVRWTGGECRWSWWWWSSHCHEGGNYRLYVPKSSIRFEFRP